MSALNRWVGWRLVIAGASSIAALLLTGLLIITGARPGNLGDASATAAKGPGPTPSPTVTPQVVKVVVKQVPVVVAPGTRVPTGSRVQPATPPPPAAPPPSSAPQPPPPSPTSNSGGSHHH